LKDVRELLRLDLAYYSASKDGALRESWSKLLIAGRQVRARPGLLLEVVRKWNLRALYLPDRKRILLDEDAPIRKQRWTEAHEVGHSILDWHQATMLGDTEAALTPLCRARIEAEANFAAGRLLFLGKRFETELNDSSLNLTTVQSLAKRYGNTITSTLWRLVEQASPPACVVGIISEHPRYSTTVLTAGDVPIKYTFYSASFSNLIGRVPDAMLWSAIRSYCSYAKRGPLGQGEFPLTSASGLQLDFSFETFHNGHEALSLGTYLP